MSGLMHELVKNGGKPFNGQSPVDRNRHLIEAGYSRS